MHTNFTLWLWSKSNGMGSSRHILLRSTSQARKLFSAQCVLQRVLLGIAPLAETPNCSGKPNQEEVGNVLSKVLVHSCNLFLFPLFNDKDNIFLSVTGGSRSESWSLDYRTLTSFISYWVGNSDKLTTGLVCLYASLCESILSKEHSKQIDVISPPT